MSKLSDQWATPNWLFEQLNKEHGPFDLDAAASDWNGKCTFVYTEEQNSLSKDWSGWWGNKVWLNPPYSDPYPWVQKASLEAKKGCKVVCLLKADHTPKWYKDFIYNYDKREFYPGVTRIDLPDRIKFVPPPGLKDKNGNPVKAGSPNYPSMVVIFEPVK
jgi:phage N-6-adenine-methyltransferase